ncbi:Cof-type HAD-IIB family hydrolase [Terrabacter sp. RAF57]|jgi:Cof subfamily protein (haloacid dehalogenase superfamily)|uniref:Cof-type HAD-IIB family hydrolase n=1 Tax=Terrabacter sp. RAF57 TaxID=3233063 RepID=UPI003F9CA4FF
MTLFCSDVDGTLLDHRRTLSSRTVAAIRAVREAGHTFVLCSSRMPASLEGLERLCGVEPTPLIAYNGGLVLRADRSVVTDVAITPADARATYAVCERLALHASFFAGDDWYAWGPDEWTEREATITAVDPSPESAHDYVSSGRVDVQPPHKVMAMGDPALVDELEAALTGRAGLVTYRSKTTYLEIANAACSKGDGLRALADELGVDVSDTVFFGDNHNDVSAFAVAGTAVAVANAVDPALDAATVVTGHHREDGVAAYLEDWLASH